MSREVRYTGLEFGVAGYQPYECKDVWKQRYGDCKDKANLLCALLRYKGIESYLALVNTRHAGKINADVPDYGQFTHAVVAIPEEDGSYAFCDPTGEHLNRPALTPSSSGRQVLVVRQDA